MRECKQHDLRIENRMIVAPVPFLTEGAKKLQHTKRLLEEPDEDDNHTRERIDNPVTALNRGSN